MGQTFATGLLTVALGGGTAALAAAGPAAPGALAATAATTAAAAAAGPAGARASERTAEQTEAELVRGSRSRRARQPPPVAAAPAPPAPPPAPAPPAPPPAPAAPAPPPELPGCEGEPATGHPNGRLPRSALCTLPGTGGHRLRADAARAFMQLRAAYHAETGRRLCVTDTYRSYEAQVRAKRSKPRLTAAPGRSNHGDGTAVDLCGGIESFGTAAHRWMRVNAGRFGWVHPAWAGPRGSRPEPWHWEYRG